MMNTLHSRRNIAIFLLIVTLFSVLSPNIAFAQDGNSGGAGNLPSITVGDGGNITLSGTGADKTKNNILNKTRDAMGFFGALALIIFIGIFIWLFSKLGAAGDNPAKRQEIQTAIMWAFIAAAGLGIVGAIVSIAFKFFA